LDIQANFTKLAETLDLSNVSSKYYEFADVFSKTKAEVLTPHHSYKQEALKKFIEKNLNIGFI